MRFLFLIFLLVNSSVCAEEIFGVEEGFPNQSQIPKNILNDISRELNLSKAGCRQTLIDDVLEATTVKIGPSNGLLIKPSSDAWCLCGAYFCPVWIYEVSSEKARRILFAPAVSLITILDKKSGEFRNIQVEGGTAGHGFEENWVWDGKKYIRSRPKQWVAE